MNHPRIVEKAYRAFFTPPVYEAKPSELDELAAGENDRIPYDGGEMAVTAWGTGSPSVLLLHGWGGSRAQMTGLVPPLRAAGYRVVAFDQPGHGENGGQPTNILEITAAMGGLAEREGAFDAIIAHSFGTLVASYALVHRGFPRPRRLVYLGAFNRLMDSLPRFQVQAGLPDAIVAGLETLIYTEFDRDLLQSIANDHLGPQLEIPALLFHDTADPVTPIEDSRAIARAWPEARLVETEGLGHRGALRSPETHAEIVRFLEG